MIALDYAIPLPRGYDTRRLRARAAETAPLFDRHPGLVWKAFLLREAEPAYAAFSLWQSAAAAADFLDGPLFGGTVESFGRPQARLWLVRDAVQPPPAPRWAVREERALALWPDRAAHLVGLDPAGWRVVDFTMHERRPAAAGAWEILHLSLAVSSYHPEKSLTS